MGSERKDGDPLIRAALPRRVAIGGEEYIVRPPTVKQAIEALTILADIGKGEDEDSWAYLTERLLPEWMPVGVVLAFCAADHLERVVMLNRLIFVDTMEGKKPPKKKKEGEVSIVDGGWDDALARYCYVYGGEPWEVYNTVPFAFFYIMLARTARHHARRTLWDAESISLPHMGKEAEKMMKKLRKLAGYNTKSAEEDFMETARKWRKAQEDARANKS